MKSWEAKGKPAFGEVIQHFFPKTENTESNPEHKILLFISSGVESSSKINPSRIHIPDFVDLVVINVGDEWRSKLEIPWLSKGIFLQIGQISQLYQAAKRAIQEIQKRPYPHVSLVKIPKAKHSESPDTNLDFVKSNSIRKNREEGKYNHHTMEVGT